MEFDVREEAVINYEQAKEYFIPENFSPDMRAKSEDVLQDLIDELGSVVNTYPVWHPLVPQHNPNIPENSPSDRTGYRGLDHTLCFVNGFITCPYGDVDKILDVIDAATDIKHPSAIIRAKKLDAVFWNENTTTVLVTCEWHKPMYTMGKMIPKKIAVPLMVEYEMVGWQDAKVAERWDTMRPYLLGLPQGKKSSLFVDERTTRAMKKIHKLLFKSGMYGPLMMD